MISAENVPLVVILDLNNAMYRYFHTTTPKLYHDQRMETAEAVLSYVKKIKAGRVCGTPDKVIAVADHPSPTFRHYVSEKYKCEREGMPPELARQEGICHQAIEAFGVPVIRKPGVEADDTMGMLANYYAEQGFKVLMITTDKDMHQLITDSIQIFHPQKKIIIDAAVSEETLGVKPYQVADLLAIAGDKVDGIDGVVGVSIVTAAKWLNQYGSVEKLISEKDNIKGKRGEALSAMIGTVILNTTLTTIRCSSAFLTEQEKSRANTHTKDEAKAKVVKDLYGIHVLSDPASGHRMSLPPIEAYAEYY